MLIIPIFLCIAVFSGINTEDGKHKVQNKMLLKKYTEKHDEEGTIIQHRFRF